MAPVAVHDDNQETDQGQDKRYVYGREAEQRPLVDDRCLSRRHDRTAEDGHNQACGAEFGVVAQSFERNAVDCRDISDIHADTPTRQYIPLMF